MDKRHRSGEKNLELSAEDSKAPGEKEGGMKPPERVRGWDKAGYHTWKRFVEVVEGSRSWQRSREAGDQNTERKG